MHMTDALLSVAVGGTMTAVSAGAIACAAKKSKTQVHRDADDYSVPLMGVTGAFVFAAQMVNIAIPGTGASGHLVGGVLLAALLGPYRALLALSGVLLVQCLFFADGGILAYGCNVFNMGVCACWLSYAAVYKPIIKRGVTRKRIIIASVAASVLALQAGALGVVVQTSLSGVAGWSLWNFAALMQPIHLAVGLMEGVITAALLSFIYSARPSLLVHAWAVPETVATTEALETDADTQQPVPLSPSLVRRAFSLRKLTVALLAAALFTGGVLSIFASQKPDGLEWSIEKAGETAEHGDR